jgi:hypothetical protein
MKKVRFKNPDEIGVCCERFRESMTIRFNEGELEAEPKPIPTLSSGCCVFCGQPRPKIGLADLFVYGKNGQGLVNIDYLDIDEGS